MRGRGFIVDARVPAENRHGSRVLADQSQLRCAFEPRAKCASTCVWPWCSMPAGECRLRFSLRAAGGGDRARIPLPPRKFCFFAHGAERVRTPLLFVCPTNGRFSSHPSSFRPRPSSSQNQQQKTLWAALRSGAAAGGADGGGSGVRTAEAAAAAARPSGLLCRDGSLAPCGSKDALPHPAGTWVACGFSVHTHGIPHLGGQTALCCGSGGGRRVALVLNSSDSSRTPLADFQSSNTPQDECQSRERVALTISSIAGGEYVTRCLRPLRYGVIEPSKSLQGVCEDSFDYGDDH